MNIKLPCFLMILFCICVKGGFCQELKPGLEGRAPSKWITFRHNWSSGSQYGRTTAQPKSYSREEWYVRAWVPLVHRPNFTVVLGPHYRLEQLELKTPGDNPMSQYSNWQLRTMGVDMKSILRLSKDSWLITAANVNRSGNLSELPSSQVPINFALTGVFLKKVSEKKEYGAGLLVSKSHNFNILPVLVFNYNFAPNRGIEISLPKKVSLRQNLSPKDILYLSAAANTRSYYTYDTNLDTGTFRRIDVDLSVIYNRQFNKLIGMELSGGYRKNVSNKLPTDIIPIRGSGFVANLEFFIKSPFGTKNGAHNE